MKKNKFQKLPSNSLFESFKLNKLESSFAVSTRGGDSTSTTLCKTTEQADDRDSQGMNEDLKDARCSGY